MGRAPPPRHSCLLLAAGTDRLPGRASPAGGPAAGAGGARWCPRGRDERGPQGSPPSPRGPASPDPASPRRRGRGPGSAPAAAPHGQGGGRALPWCPAEGPGRRLLLRLRRLLLPPMPGAGGTAGRGAGGWETPAGPGHPRLSRPAPVYRGSPAGRAACQSAAPPRPAPAAMARRRTGKRGGSAGPGRRLPPAGQGPPPSPHG